MTRIVEVRNKRQLRQFITFPERLYKNCPQWVPALVGDEYDTLSEKNSAMEYCEYCLFLALDEKDTLVGRVAAIINRRANERWKEQTVRFGWIDFVNDIEVAKALTDAVADWGRKRGMAKIKGPLGFTDFDREGMLVDGYDKLSPFTCIYNYPYYNELLSQLGFSKDADWIQTLINIPSELPTMFRYARLLEEKIGVRALSGITMKDIVDNYALDAFHVVNETFAQLYEYAPFSDEQILRYIKTYSAILDPDFVCILVNAENKVIGFGFCVPSLSKAVKKSNGRLLPFGIFRIMRALKKNDTLEALVVGIKPEYQGSGAGLLLLEYLHKNCIKRGITRMIVNPQLENNLKVQSMFNGYDTQEYLRRRSYVRDI